jgi:hypothetical protein
MKIIQTLWTCRQSDNGDHSIDIKAGWPSCEYHWMSWAFSCLQARALFDEVELITDNLGKEILIDKLGLPYTAVSTALEGALDEYPPQIWAAAKLLSYQLQTEPFLHIDSDVYLWQRPDDQILNSGIIAQNLEKNILLYKNTLIEINAKFPYLPQIYKKDYFANRDIYAGNAGLIGGNDLDFFKTYTKEAFEFLHENNQFLSALYYLPNLNFIFEQYALFQIAARENKSISYYHEPIVETPLYEDFIRFQDLPATKMVHPVGGFKGYSHLCRHLVNNLRTAYPSYYYSLINLLLKEGIPLLNKIYSSRRLNLPELREEEKIAGRGSQRPDAVYEPPDAVYERTLEALSLWNLGEALVQAVKSDCLSIEEFTHRLDKHSDAGKLDAGKQRELILELYRLEFQKGRLLENIFYRSADLTAMYREDLRVYRDHRSIFALPGSWLSDARIAVAENALVVELGWQWYYVKKEEIRPMLINNLAQDRSYRQAVLLPAVLSVNIEEYYLDELDMLIVETANVPVMLNKLIGELKQYFDINEINADPSAFEKLVIDSIKRLAFAGVLKTVFVNEV